MRNQWRVVDHVVEDLFFGLSVKETPVFAIFAQRFHFLMFKIINDFRFVQSALSPISIIVSFVHIIEVVDIFMS